MNTLRLVVVLLFLFTATTPALPVLGAEPNWNLVDTNENSSFYYDKNSITTPREDVVRLIARAVYTEAGKAEALRTLGNTKGLENLYESRYLYDIDCVEREAHLMSVSHMDKNGLVLRSSDLGTVTDWEYLPVMTRLAFVADAVCAP